MTLSDRAQRKALGAGWIPILLGVIAVVELVLLLGAFVPLLGTSAAVDANRPVLLSYLWWRTTVTKPSVFVIISFVGGALGGTLHGIASLTAHVSHADFDRRWTMWYLVNPLVGASLATVFLCVLQAGLGGQAAPTTGGLYGIAAVATLVGLFSRHALRKLKEIFDVAFANRIDEGSATSPPRKSESTPDQRTGTGQIGGGDT